jgi:hypothetical protein
MSWVLLAIAAQFLSAVSVLIDKHIVVRARAIGEPLAYAYFTVVFAAGASIVALFGTIHVPTVEIVVLSIL